MQQLFNGPVFYNLFNACPVVSLIPELIWFRSLLVFLYFSFRLESTSLPAFGWRLGVFFCTQLFYRGSACLEIVFFCVIGQLFCVSLQVCACTLLHFLVILRPNLLLILLTLFFLLFYVLSEIHSSFHFIGPYICCPLSNNTSLNVIFCIKSPYISEYVLYIKRYRVIKVQSFVGFQRWTLSHSRHLLHHIKSLINPNYIQLFDDSVVIEITQSLS